MVSYDFEKLYTILKKFQFKVDMKRKLTLSILSLVYDIDRIMNNSSHASIWFFLPQFLIKNIHSWWNDRLLSGDVHGDACIQICLHPIHNQ